jgi:hypothetical protein
MEHKLHGLMRSSGADRMAFLTTALTMLSLRVVWRSLPSTWRWFDGTLVMRARHTRTALTDSASLCPAHGG